MKVFIILSALVSLGLALPLSGGEFPVSVRLDTNGDYELKYALADSSRHEESLNGQVHGSYEFVDKEGYTHKVFYLAGPQGYLAEGESIPVSVGPTAEVAHAAAEHHELYAEIAKNLPVLPLEETDPEAAAALKGSYFVEPIVKYVPQQYLHADEHYVVSEAAGGDTSDVAAIKQLHQVADQHVARFA